MSFTKATKDAANKGRIALLGPRGSVTETSLEIASQLASATGKRVAVIDADHGSSCKYADHFDFDCEIINDHNPENFVRWIKEAEKTGNYGALVIHDLSKSHDGKNGNLDLVKAAGGKFRAWQNVTPKHEKLVEAIAGSSLHIVATLRTKHKHDQERDGNKDVVRYLGEFAIHRDDMTEVFEVIGMQRRQAGGIIFPRCNSCSELRGVEFYENRQIGSTITKWLSSGGKQDPEVTERLKALEQLMEYAEMFGIPRNKLREIGAETPGVRNSDPKTWTLDHCSRVRRFIDESRAFRHDPQHTDGAQHAPVN